MLDILKDSQGKTALMYACAKGYAFIVKLLTRRENLELEDNIGMTPLLESYSTRNYGIARWLLIYGANYNRRSNDGYAISQDFVNMTLNAMPTVTHEELVRRQTRLERFGPVYDEYTGSGSYGTGSVRLVARGLIRTPIHVSPPTSSIIALSPPIKKVTKPRDGIIKLIIKDFVDKETCAISYEVLTIENTTLTSCFHAFEKDSISCWLVNKKTCPVCREECVLW